MSQALDRDSRLYNGPPALWPLPGTAAQLEVFHTGTARARLFKYLYPGIDIHKYLCPTYP